jgi:N-acyl-phosphatidylethanolamine-hydrolysing phospholipase D
MPYQRPYGSFMDNGKLLGSQVPSFSSPHQNLARRPYLVLPSNFRELASQTADAIKYYFLGWNEKATESTSSKRLLLLTSNLQQRAALNYKRANSNLERAFARGGTASPSVSSIATPKRHKYRAKGRRAYKMVRENYVHYNRKARCALKDRYARTATSILSSFSQSRSSAPSTEVTSKFILTRRAKRLFRRFLANGNTTYCMSEFRKMLRNSPDLMQRLRQGNMSGARLVELTDVNDHCKFDSQGFPLVSYALQEEATSDTEPAPPARFINPWSASSCEHEPLSKYAKWRWHRLANCPDIAPKDHGHYLARTKPYMSKLSTKDLPFPIDSNTDRVGFTWIGHSTCLVQMHGFAILTDPVFSNVVGPLAPLQGDTRYVQPSHTVDELGDSQKGPLRAHNGIIDMVCISHDHYDHLDYSSIYQLVQSDKVLVKKWCVPLGTKKWLLDNFGNDGNSNNDGKYIHEEDILDMSWWDDHTVTNTDLERGVQKQLKVTCAPSQHWCARTPFDRNTRLWASFAFEASEEFKDGWYSREERSPKNRLAFYFGGDTGVPENDFPLFSQIGDRLGPFDLSALPIGAYLPDKYIGDSHVGPEETSQIADELRSRQNVAIHWGTFPMGDEPFYEPAKLLRSVTAESPEEKFIVVRQGESFMTRAAASEKRDTKGEDQSANLFEQNKADAA